MFVFVFAFVWTIFSSLISLVYNLSKPILSRQNSLGFGFFLSTMYFDLLLPLFYGGLLLAKL